MTIFHFSSKGTLAPMIAPAKHNPGRLNDVIESGMCIGCGLCAGVSLDASMHMTPQGHLEPRFSTPLSTEDEQALYASCPGVNLNLFAPPRTPFEHVWGRQEGMWAGHAIDEDLRFRSSSGGALSAVASSLLLRRKVDAVLHIAASSADPKLNEVYLSRSPEEITLRSGSRYGPAAPLSTLGDVLKLGERIAFIGKPCDAAALRQFLELHPEHQNNIPYIFSFFCAGEPSIHATDQLLDNLGVAGQDLQSFRYRGHGWPGKATAITVNGQEVACSYEKSWGEVLGKRLHPRCKACPEGIGLFADIVFADVWETQDGYPDFEDKPGESLIIARTPEAREVIEQAVELGHLSIRVFTGETLPTIQAYQRNRRHVALARLLAHRHHGGQRFHFRGLSLIRNAIFSNWRHLLGNYRGSKKRILEQKRKVETAP